MIFGRNIQKTRIEFACFRADIIGAVTRLQEVGVYWLAFLDEWVSGWGNFCLLPCVSLP